MNNRQTNSQRGGNQRRPNDPHQVLGLAPGATREQINTAYRHALRHLHPDTRPPPPDTEPATGATAGTAAGAADLSVADLQHARRELLRAEQRRRAEQARATQRNTGQRNTRQGGAGQGGAGRNDPGSGGRERSTPRSSWVRGSDPRAEQAAPPASPRPHAYRPGLGEPTSSVGRCVITARRLDRADLAGG